MKEYIEGKYKLTTKIVIKQPSVFELVTQFVEKIGWVMLLFDIDNDISWNTNNKLACVFVLRVVSERILG